MSKVLIFGIMLVSMIFIGCNKNKEVVEKLQFRDGVAYKVNTEKPFTGKLLSKYDNQQKKYEVTFIKGKVNGKWTKYYKNGSKEITGSSINGIMNGELVLFYENGKEQVKLMYKMGEQDGAISTWDNTGNNSKMTGIGETNNMIPYLKENFKKTEMTVSQMEKKINSNKKLFNHIIGSQLAILEILKGKSEKEKWLKNIEGTILSDWKNENLTTKAILKLLNVIFISKEIATKVKEQGMTVNQYLGWQKGLMNGLISLKVRKINEFQDGELLKIANTLGHLIK